MGRRRLTGQPRSLNGTPGQRLMELKEEASVSSWEKVSGQRGLSTWLIQERRGDPGGSGAGRAEQQGLRTTWRTEGLSAEAEREGAAGSGSNTAGRDGTQTGKQGP